MSNADEPLLTRREELTLLQVARETLERIGESHGRSELDIRPDLYELWLDSVCQTVKLLDPEWTQALQLAWRDQLRPGISFITSHY